MQSESGKITGEAGKIAGEVADWPALCIAMHESYGRTEEVRKLLAGGADIEERGPEGVTPLICAVHEGHEAVVRLLLEDGADISIKDSDGRTPLHHAALGNHNSDEAVAQLLLEKGADVSLKARDESTPLHFAACQGALAVLRLLLEHGADASAKTKEYGKTALHGAAFEGHEAVVRLLLDHGSDVSATTRQGKTSEEFATRRSFHRIAQMLRAEAARRAQGVVLPQPPARLRFSRAEFFWAIAAWIIAVASRSDLRKPSTVFAFLGACGLLAVLGQIDALRTIAVLSGVGAIAAVQAMVAAAWLPEPHWQARSSPPPPPHPTHPPPLPHPTPAPPPLPNHASQVRSTDSHDCRLIRAFSGTNPFQVRARPLPGTSCPGQVITGDFRTQRLFSWYSMSVRP